MSQWLSNLNEEQMRAAQHAEGPLLILAGAGSGKTTVLVSRTGHLIEAGKARADEILVLTFTNKAARELNHRVKTKLGDGARGLWTGTFHSFGLQLLRKNSKLLGLPKTFGIIDASDSAAIVNELLKDLNISGRAGFKTETLMSMMDDWRSRGQRKAKNDDGYEIALEVLLPKYVSRLKSLGVVDFQSLLLKPIELLQENSELLVFLQNRFKFIMVDEFQDTNTLQFKLLELLSAQHKNLGVVGDDDQSIYGWRGAQVQNILNFPHRFDNCEVVRLEKNYRSTPAILEVANSVIKKNKERHEKQLVPGLTPIESNKPEVFFYDDESFECEGVVEQINYFCNKGYKIKDMAVLYRSNGQGGLLEAVLRQSQIPYSVTGSFSLFDKKEVKDLLAYLRCSLRPNEVALRRVINTPARGIGDTTIEKIHNHAEALNISFYQALKRWKQIEIKEGIGAQIDEFLLLLQRLPEFLLSPENDQSVGERFLTWVKNIGYYDYMRKSYKSDDAFTYRWSSVEIMAKVINTFVDRGGKEKKTIRDFVDAMELRDCNDEDSDKEDKVQLLTFHACKGLEWPVVIMIGVEEDLIPHRTLGTDVSEERRLFYVGLTRAKEHLVLTRSLHRKRYGKMMPSAPSRFLQEIPPHLITSYEGGHRPVSAEKKQALLGDLMKKLESQIETQKIDPKQPI